MTKKEIIAEMLKAYYAVVYPGREVPYNPITGLTMDLIYEGKEPWGEAEEAAFNKLLEIRKSQLD